MTADVWARAASAADARVLAQDDAIVFVRERYMAAHRMGTAFRMARHVREQAARERALTIAHGQYLQRVRSAR